MQSCPCALTKHHTMKAYWGVEIQLHAFLDLGIRWRLVVSFTPWPLYPQGKSLLYPLDRRLGGPQVAWNTSAEGRTILKGTPNE
jgi:hypothetical protein